MEGLLPHGGIALVEANVSRAFAVTANGQPASPPLPLVIVRDPVGREFLRLAEAEAERRQVKGSVSSAVVLGQVVADIDYGTFVIKVHGRPEAD